MIAGITLSSCFFLFALMRILKILLTEKMKIINKVYSRQENHLTTSSDDGSTSIFTITSMMTQPGVRELNHN
jgi:hypothetical protein